MRTVGYRGPIAIPCIAYANRCDDYDNGSWLQYRPSDPLHQLVAEAHVYGKNACDTSGSFDATYAPIAARVPMIRGETGETYDASDCGTSWISMAVPWAERHGIGYMAWSWNTWSDDCTVLISNYDGTPTPFGAWVHQHYAMRAAQQPDTSAPSPSASAWKKGASGPC